MANINLLPWREWERERKRKEFLLSLGGVALLGVIALLAWGQKLDGDLSNQQARNDYYAGKIAELDQQIIQIATLRKERAALLDRMRVIQELQGNRPVIVHVFDEIVQKLPSGVHFNKLEMLGQDIQVEGAAESNNRISALMRNLNDSEWFTNPTLKSIKEDTTSRFYGPGASVFDLTFRQVNPNDADEDGQTPAGKPAVAAGGS
ncbi:MAG: PilN domain-containing protein [Pseudomonadales bacterium]|nr:PilN domain-containing protein [Pseudomonadales bacterium]